MHGCPAKKNTVLELQMLYLPCPLAVPHLSRRGTSIELRFRLMEFEAGLPLWHMTLGKGTDFLVYKVECVSHICLVSQSEGLMNCVI